MYYVPNIKFYHKVGSLTKSFTTEETGYGKLIASYIGYEDYELEAPINEMVGLKLRFRESVLTTSLLLSQVVL